MAQADFTRISSNIAALNTLNSLRNINNRLGKAQLRLATGKRINQASDDPAGLTIALKMNARNEGLKAALGNIGDAKNMLAVGEGGLNQISSILITMQSKALAAASETLGDDERDAIVIQLRSLAMQINDIVDETTWNSEGLLGGNVTKSLQTGAAVGDTTDLTLATSHKATDATGLALGTLAGNIGIVGSDRTGKVGSTDASFTGDLDSTGVDRTAASWLATLDTGTYDLHIMDRAASAAVGKAVESDASDTWGTASAAAVAPGGTELASGTYRIVFAGAEAARTWEVYDTFSGALTTSSAAAVDWTGGGAFSLTDGTGTIGVAITDDSDVIGIGTEFQFEYIAKNTAKVELREVSVDPDGITDTYRAVAVDANENDDTGNDLTRAFFYEAAAGTYDTGLGFDVTLGAEGAIVTDHTTQFALTPQGSVTLNLESSDSSGWWTANSARSFVTTLNTAIGTVSSSLNSIGSLTARLDSKEETVAVGQVNIEAAYNRIMNADMAYEQVEASKYMILQQTAIAMLAQSNMAPQGILSLFR